MKKREREREKRIETRQTVHIVHDGIAGQRVPRQGDQDVGGQLSPGGVVHWTPVGGGRKQQGQVVPGG